MAKMKKGIRQGYYKPKNESKWIITEAFDSKGVPGIKYRSSWELKFMKFCDYNPYILKVNSEGMVIDYISPKDGKIHKYYMDFMLETTKSVWLVEVKPLRETIPPKPPKNDSEKSAYVYQKAIETYAVNCAKWEATEKLCEERGWIFKIITEKELF